LSEEEDEEDDDEEEEEEKEKEEKERVVEKPREKSLGISMMVPAAASTPRGCQISTVCCCTLLWVILDRLSGYPVRRFWWPGHCVQAMAQLRTKIIAPGGGWLLIIISLASNTSYCRARLPPHAPACLPAALEEVAQNRKRRRRHFSALSELSCYVQTKQSEKRTKNDKVWSKFFRVICLN
jgi:hypothetical protein